MFDWYKAKKEVRNSKIDSIFAANFGSIQS